MRLLEWNVITTVDLSCTDCGTQFVLISKNLMSDFPGNFKIICVNCFQLKDFSDLNLEQQHILTDRFELISNIGVDIISESFGKLLRISSKMSAVEETFKVKLNKGRVKNKTPEDSDSPFKKKSWIANLKELIRSLKKVKMMVQSRLVIEVLLGYVNMKHMQLNILLKPRATIRLKMILVKLFLNAYTLKIIHMK